MRFRAVGGVGGVPAADVAPQVAGETAAAQEDLDHRGGEPDIDALAGVLVGDRVEGPSTST